MTSRETAEIFTSCDSEAGKETRKKRKRQKVETKVTRRERKYNDVKGGGEKWIEGRGNYAMKESKKIKTLARNREKEVMKIKSEISILDK